MTFDVILNEYCAPEHDFDGTNRDELADPIERTGSDGPTLETLDSPIVPEGRQ